VIKPVWPVLFASLVFLGCGQILDVEKKPETQERQTPLKIMLQDQSGYMQTLFNSSGVRGADVLVKSNSLSTEVQAQSDSTGLVTLQGLISDTYLISASRQMSAEEMQHITGQPVTNHKLTNRNMGIIDLHADQEEPVTLPMDVVYAGSPLVISEIYACGPPGSGLYFHDKYLELYNQSDSTVYLDGLIVAVVYYSGYLGLNFIDDPEYVHSTNVWMIPGKGTDHPLQPGELAVCAEDAIDHRNNAPNSVDLSGVRFEFYKRDAPDIDNPAVPNMKRVMMEWGNDWLIGGESDALVIARIDPDSLGFRDGRLLIPYTAILDGVEYLDDPSRLDKKTLNPQIDAGTTGGIEFYTGKSMERIVVKRDPKPILKDDNNSSLDFRVIESPTPETLAQE
jgi:hypothetical protein